MPLFGGKTFPGKRLGERGQRLPLSAISGTFVGGPMDTEIDAFTPDVRLAIEVIDIREGDPCPIAVLRKTNGALDFALGLSRQLHRLPL
jgi:hypothetical protein